MKKTAPPTTYAMHDPRIERVLNSAPPEIRRLLSQYVNEPLMERGELAALLYSYLEAVERAADRMTTVDVKLARRIWAQCKALLDGWDAYESDDERRLVQAAIRYFGEEEDAESDLASPTGFEDDANVVELVVGEVG
jgi:hypothetical protein